VSTDYRLDRDWTVPTHYPKRNRLFIAGSQSLYALYVDAQGAPLGDAPQ
jgi:hypothetical protein